VATVRDALIALGLWGIRDLAFSCTLPLMFPKLSSAVGKEVSWRHAFGAAAVSHRLGVVFANGNQQQTYLCGQLHDIGILVNCLLFPDDFGDVLEEAIADRVAIEIAERRALGFAHAESGRILAEKWRLPLIIPKPSSSIIIPPSRRFPSR
jgi:HD-like signal output (HDOD) protein